MKVIGLMSGTSSDGVDAALVDIRGSKNRLKITPLAFNIFPFPRSLQKRLLEVASDLPQPASVICHVNFLLGEYFADAAIKLAKQNHTRLADIHLVGSHGQTIQHLPNPRRAGKWSIRSTLQLGEPSIIAEKTGITTIADFRPRDMAAGGEGAPLTPFLHYHLFRSQRISRVLVNIGGISNITYLKAGAKLDQTWAFDTGPGNMLIDGLVRALTKTHMRMDLDGKMAKEGKVNARLLTELMRHPFLKKQPPKSTGREVFGDPMVEKIIKRSLKLGLSAKDIISTVTAFTSEAIAASIKRFILKKGVLDEIIAGGGGVRNPVLMKSLKEALAPIPVQRYEHHGYDSRAIEAMAFAVLAYQTWHMQPSNIPSVTGAHAPTLLGKIVPGRSLPRIPSLK